MDNYESGLYTDNPDDTLRYMQTVEVVRCRNCKHWREVYQDQEGNKHGFCEFLPVDNATFFCAFGERKTDEID